MTELLLMAFMGYGTTPAFAPKPADVPAPTPSEIMQLTRLPRLQTGHIAPVLVDDDNMALLSVDWGTGKELVSQNADRPQFIASISKLMTAYIIRRDMALSDTVFVPQVAVETEGAGVDLLLDEELSVGTLLEAMLVPSANDAAVTLAVAHSGSVEAFVVEMNRTATEDLELASASFVNPTGLDIEVPYIDPSTGLEEVVDQGNQMSAREVIRLFQLVYADPITRQMLGQSEFFGTSVDGQFSHEKPTTNQLLGSFVNVSAGKTGYTYAAGQCLVVIGQHNGQAVISVILGSGDRFTETKKVLSWIYDSYIW